VTELLLTDPRGRRLGFEPNTQRQHAEVPRAGYDEGTGPVPGRKPSKPVVYSAIKVPAALVLRDEGRQGVEHIRHGTRRLAQPPGEWPSLLPIRAA